MAAHRYLKISDGDGVPHVPIPAPAPVEFAGIVQHGNALAFPLRVGQGMATAHFLREDGEIGPLNAARGAAEAQVDHAGGEAHGFEDLGALIGLEGGNAHLGHDLQEALGRALAVRGHDVVVTLDVWRVIQKPILARLPEGFKGQVGINGIGAIAHEQAQMVDFPGFPRFHHETDARTRMGFDQVMMHRAGGEERAQGDPLSAHRAIG